jgi:hypothetical protein
MNTALRVIRTICIIVFVAGIAGMIFSSINGNNVGLVTTIGLITAVAALVLLTASSVGARRRIDVFDDVLAERIETQIGELSRDGVSEDRLRRLVADSIDLGRRAT